MLTRITIIILRAGRSSQPPCLAPCRDLASLEVRYQHKPQDQTRPFQPQQRRASTPHERRAKQRRCSSRHSSASGLCASGNKPAPFIYRKEIYLHSRYLVGQLLLLLLLLHFRLRTGFWILVLSRWEIVSTSYSHPTRFQPQTNQSSIGITRMTCGEILSDQVWSCPCC